MPVRDRIVWGKQTPLSDPRLAGLPQFVAAIRAGRIPQNVTGGSEFRNLGNDLPTKEPRYYTEYDVQVTVAGVNRGKLRIVLGRQGEVYITGNHYTDFRQIVDMPTEDVEARLQKTLRELEAFRQSLQNRLDLNSGEHQAQVNLYNTSFAGFVTNQLFNSAPPDTTIWINAGTFLRAAQRSIGRRDVASAFIELNKARGYYLQALSRYLTWKDGIAGAGTKMQVAIGATALVLITAGTAAYLASAAAAAGGATVTAAEAATAATTYGPRVQAAMRVFVQASTAEEAAAAERLIERAVEEELLMVLK